MSYCLACDNVRHVVIVRHVIIIKMQQI